MSTQLAAMNTRYGFSDEQVDVIKATIAPGATNEELALFLMVCQKKGLDPFSRQIYLSERRSFNSDTQQWVVKKSPETTIDGFRCIAERSGKYEGQLGPLWCGTDGDWRDVWLGSTMPSAAKVGVLRKDFKEPVWGIALFEEYVQTTKDGKPNKMWQKMGANQLAKCAESLALRKAFPADLSGMYTREEMAQSTKDDEASSKEAQQEVAQRRIHELQAANPIAPAVYAELADSLDAPQPSEYEMREKLRQHEAAEALKGPKTKGSAEGGIGSSRKRGAISFTALKAWGEIKKEILKLTGTTDLYYEALKAGGYSHADEIKTQDDAAKIWKALKAITSELTPKAQDRTLEEELQRYQRDNPKFIDKLGAHGFESVADVIERANGTQTGLLLSELRQK